MIRFTEEWLTSLRSAGERLSFSEPEIVKNVRHKVLWEPTAVPEQDVVALKSLGYAERDIFCLILDAAAQAGQLRLQLGLEAIVADIANCTISNQDVAPL